MNKFSRPTRLIVGLIILGSLWFFRTKLGLGTDFTTYGSRSSGSGTAELLSAFEKKQSGLMLETSGVVTRLLRDDLEGSRHQNFILQIEGSTHTVKVSHNIDLAERMPLDVGDEIALRGQYEFTEQGGVLHWTHKDPSGRRAGGWIEHRSKRYH
jgi:hypothetical protein